MSTLDSDSPAPLSLLRGLRLKSSVYISIIADMRTKDSHFYSDIIGYGQSHVTTAASRSGDVRASCRGQYHAFVNKVTVTRTIGSFWTKIN